MDSNIIKNSRRDHLSQQIKDTSPIQRNNQGVIYFKLLSFLIPGSCPHIENTTVFNKVVWFIDFDRQPIRLPLNLGTDVNNFKCILITCHTHTISEILNTSLFSVLSLKLYKYFVRKVNSEVLSNLPEFHAKGHE